MEDDFLRIRDIPYRLPTQDNLTDASCVFKHMELYKQLVREDVLVRYRVGSYRWEDVPLPQEVLCLPHALESTHLFLEQKVGETWRVLDATWDRGLRKVFSVNNWNPNKEMEIAFPTSKILSPEASQMFIDRLERTENFILKWDPFYQAVNSYLEEVRSQA